MIKTVISTDMPQYSGNWEEFQDWIKDLKEVQFDIETNVTSFWCTKSCKTMQFGDVEGNVQYVLEFGMLSPGQVDYIKSILEDWSVLKLIHNAAFEYIVLKFYDIEIHNVYCTMIAEKILNGGIENANYSLSDLTWKYCNLNLDKTLQTSFGDGYLTPEKIKYAADDVVHLGKIRDIQKVEIDNWNLGNAVWLEMRCLLAFSDCTFHGVKLDNEKWMENVSLAEPIVNQAKLQLDQWIREDVRLLDKAVSHGYYKTEDTINFNINAHTQKAELLKMVFPDIEGGSLGVIKKYIRNHPNLPTEQQYILASLEEKDTKPLIDYLIEHHNEELISRELVLPKGTININWNSQQQALNVLQGVEPKLKGLDEESLSKTTHEVFIRLSEYKDSLKLMSSFGEAFIEKFVEPDGRVRTNYNQVVSTGRSSSLKPNMQQIPGYEAVGNRYRNCFIYEPGWKFVDSDYTGQELCLIAFASQDDVWYKAIERGEDLHSVTAAMVFGKKWTDATQDGCVFVTKRDKCKCKGHKTFRTAIKSVNFGLAYGMSQYKLASTLKCSVKEAEKLIDDYFKTFPQIKKTLQSFGMFGVQNGYTQTLSPIFRKRWFPTWEMYKTEIESHLKGIQFNTALGRIERQSKNHPIQGSGADIIKLAMWKTYKYIRDNNLQSKIHLLLNVHDQLTTTCTEDIAEWWKVEFDNLMCEAAKVIIPSGLLKADTNISDVWTK